YSHLLCPFTILYNPIHMHNYPSFLTTILHYSYPSFPFFFFFNDPPPTEIYTLSLHDALPISHRPGAGRRGPPRLDPAGGVRPGRSEEHTSELQSLAYLVCRLLLEKKK